ncbi:hypothetical protein M5D96_012838 [Drosophila gunungcola]|uniref:Uncharacterized protein n=1 Tax=Drosophila gunungcola TaxID=103775 RepID=A0A9P9YCG6_9MUSC|nr:hypothetical protein M5D96_012838 [Drosophila gunungcola]
MDGQHRLRAQNRQSDGTVGPGLCTCVHSNKLCSLHLTLFCHFHFVPQTHTDGMDYCG